MSTSNAEPRRVEVRTRFDGRWVAGFELVGTNPDGNDRRFVIRRCSDRSILPAAFSADEIRPAASSIVDRASGAAPVVVRT